MEGLYGALLVFLGIAAFAAYHIPWKDPYGLFHLKLNQDPGQGSDSTPKTEWMNLGFWEDTDIFPRACRALAVKLYQAVGLRHGERILDVGHGTGESLVMILTDPELPRPSILTGITSLPVQHNRARERIGHILSPNGAARSTEVDLYCGDAVCRDADTPKHPLHPLNTVKFDVIFVLDCVYHFHTRKQFLEQAYQKLAPGGRIALSDFCYSMDGSPTWFATFLATRIAHVTPQENMLSVKAYIEELEQLGYVDVVLEDVTQNVIPGIVRFLRGRGIFWRVYSRFFAWYTRVAQVHYVVVTGRKP